MKTPLPDPTAIFSALILMLCIQTSQAGSATWKRNPRSGDWNTKTNWTPATVPNGSADTATFALSNTTAISISANTELNGITFTAAATNPYTITANPTFTLTLSGAGIVNNSGTTQNVVTAVDASVRAGTIVFSNGATGGSNVSIFNGNGTINFLNTSTAGGATINDLNFLNDFDPTTNFFNRSTAGNSTIFTDTSSVLFANNSTAGSAFIDIHRNSFLRFANNSTAANSNIGIFYNSNAQFLDNSTAGSASLGLGDNSDLTFGDHSTASSANLRHS